ncbi:Stigma-specific protein, Stig1 [Musa troglodytarum]|uniref:Stigma-specific protein, Stig1 n=1 Tax=Musa troglodytarum TaxID=320322 RepID=A0A9E7FZF0_9LILI|nr:Stigma-specific protein, Stig1 [Musa troglodytarum]
MRFFFVVACAMALTTSLALSVSSVESDERSTAAAAPSLLSRYHARGLMTCDNVPRVCRASDSPGPDCCRKQCVNVMTDNQNCGQCGKKCRFGQACCGGNRVNVMYDPKNCGGCNKRCKKGSFCQYGMCSYA